MIRALARSVELITVPTHLQVKPFEHGEALAFG